MNEHELPDVHIDDDGQRVEAPSWEAMEQCHMMWTSETGQTGPTLVEAGSQFISESTPCYQWRPLNRAAAERMEKWLDSLPSKGENIPQEFVSQAAMQLRPKEGDPEFPHDRWWEHVMKLATTLYAKHTGKSGSYIPRAAAAYNPNRRNIPIMPFASTSGLAPLEPGRPTPGAAQHLPQSTIAQAARARRTQTKPVMPGTEPAVSPQQVR